MGKSGPRASVSGTANGVGWEAHCFPGWYEVICRGGAGLSRSWSPGVQLPHRDQVRLRAADDALVRYAMPETKAGREMSIPWALHMNAISAEEPSRLVRLLTGAILGCGGWVLSRSASDTGTVNMLFEFERQACVDIYSVLVAAGVELSQSGHIRFTELCQCTRNQRRRCDGEIASIELEIQTLVAEAAPHCNAPAA